MGFLIFGKAHTGRLYGYLHSADIGQVVYCLHPLERFSPTKLPANAATSCRAWGRVRRKWASPAPAPLSLPLKPLTPLKP